MAFQGEPKLSAVRIGFSPPLLTTVFMYHEQLTWVFCGEFKVTEGRRELTLLRMSWRTGNTNSTVKNTLRPIF